MSWARRILAIRWVHRILVSICFAVSSSVLNEASDVRVKSWRRACLSVFVSEDCKVESRSSGASMLNTVALVNEDFRSINYTILYQDDV